MQTKILVLDSSIIADRWLMAGVYFSSLTRRLHDMDFINFGLKTLVCHLFDDRLLKL